MGEFKGTKGKWRVVTPSGYGKSTLIMHGTDIIAQMVKFESKKANALLISKAPEMLEMLKNARLQLSRIKLSMLAHPDCTSGSEFDDYTSSAQECENEIEKLIKEATEL